MARPSLIKLINDALASDLVGRLLQRVVDAAASVNLPPSRVAEFQGLFEHFKFALQLLQRAEVRSWMGVGAQTSAANLLSRIAAYESETLDLAKSDSIRNDLTTLVGVAERWRIIALTDRADEAEDTIKAAKRLGNSAKKLEEDLQKHGSSLKDLINEAERAEGDLKKAIAAINKARGKSSVASEAVTKHRKAARKAREEIEKEQRDAQKARAGAEAEQSRVEKFSGRVSELENELGTMKKTADQILDSNNTSITSFIGRLEEGERAFQARREATETKINEVLSRATSASLFEAWGEAARKMFWSRIVYEALLAITIGLGIWFAFSITRGTITWELVLMKLVFGLPIAFGIAYWTARTGRRVVAEEELQYRSTISVTFEGYRGLLGDVMKIGDPEVRSGSLAFLNKYLDKMLEPPLSLQHHEKDRRATRKDKGHDSSDERITEKLLELGREILSRFNAGT